MFSSQKHSKDFWYLCVITMEGDGMRQEAGTGWVVLRDPKTISERMRRPIIAKATAMRVVANKVTNADDDDTFSEDEFLSLYAFNDLVAVAVISEWSWDFPVSLDGLLDLPAGDYDAVLKITAPLVSDLMPSFEPDPDADSPTVPSDE